MVITVKTEIEAAEGLDRIADGTSLVDEAKLRKGRTANLQDALNLAPGVYARSRFGQNKRLMCLRMCLPWPYLA